MLPFDVPAFLQAISESLGVAVPRGPGRGQNPDPDGTMTAFVATDTGFETSVRGSFSRMGQVLSVLENETATHRVSQSKSRSSILGLSRRLS
jgi:hypothetical protein